MKNDIRKIKTWIKCKKVSQLWIYLCALSETDHQNKLRHSQLMREALKKANDSELDKSIDLISKRIKAIESLQTVPVEIELNEDFSLLRP